MKLPLRRTLVRPVRYSTVLVRVNFLQQCALRLLLTCLPLVARADKVFDFNPTCRAAYQEIISLKLNTGQQLLNAEKKLHPNNLVPYYLENYIDFFTLFFNEDPAEYKKRVDNLSRRLDLMSEGPQSSPYYLLTRALIHFQWAAVKIKFGYTWDAGWEFRRSFLQIKENKELFPEFSPNELYFGIMQVTVGTIPDGYRWLSKLLGMKGSISGGMASIKKFLARTDDAAALYHNEAIFYYCYLTFYMENERAEVFNFIRQQHLDLKNNHLFAYLAANLSINNRQSDTAQKIILARNLSPDYLVTPVWDLEIGYATLHHLQPDAAMYLERFLSNFKGKFYVKDALQKLSWHYYLLGDLTKATYYRQQILKRGATETEADRLAQQEAKSGKWPNPLLLRARLLNDGGFAREALALLYGKRVTDFALPEEKAEFAYRAGRVLDDVGRPDNAIYFYREAIRLGENRREYFAARAAWQLGNISEQKGDVAGALNWYQRCLDMKDHDFKNSLDQKAKAGIARCKHE